MYLQNKYKNWYFSIIETAKSRNEIVEYTESHHILPKSMGGSNKKENLVNLTTKEHYVVHHLLTKMTTGEYKKKMIYAFWRMTTSNDIKISSKQYEMAKKMISGAASDAMKITLRKKWDDPNSKYNSEEYKNLASINSKNLWEDLDSTFNTPECRKNKSDSTKRVYTKPGMRERHSIIMKEVLGNPDIKEKLSIIQQEVQNRPERIQIQSDSIKKLWDDPNSFYNTDEYRLNQSFSQKEVQNRPEVKDKIFEKNAKNYIITNPEGLVYKVKGLAKFCRENDLHAGNMSSVASGKLKQYKGWTCVRTP